MSKTVKARENCFTLIRWEVWLDKWYQRNWSKYPRGESYYSNFWKPYWNTITQEFYSFCRLLWNISRPPVHLLVEDSTPCHIRPIKYTHVYHEIFFFGHEHFGKDFYHFALTLIWLYVIHLIYSWQRRLSPYCAHSGILMKWEKLKPQMILRRSEMFMSIKFSI